MRFQTDFTGPFNTTIGLFHWERESPIAAYRVMFNGGDYGAAVLGQTFGSLLPSNVALLVVHGSRIGSLKCSRPT